MDKNKIFSKVSSVLSRKKINGEQQLEMEESLRKNTLPTHISMSSFYNLKIKNKNIQMIFVFSICLFTVIMQELRFNSKLYQVASDMKNREFLLVPGIPDYMKVRPGEMPTVNVLGFSDWFISQYMNFYYGDIDVKYVQLEDYMTPQYREQFKIFTNKEIKEVKDLSVSQVYQFEPAKEAKRNTDKNGSTYYTVTYIGKTVRYTNDELLPPSEPQVVVLKFKTAKIDTTKIWTFEVVNMSVMKKSEYDLINKISSSEKITDNARI